MKDDDFYSLMETELKGFSDDEVDVLYQAAESDSRYRFEIFLSVAAALITPIALALLSLRLAKELALGKPARLIIAAGIIATMYGFVRLVYPINDWRIKQSVLRQIARRKNAGGADNPLTPN
ncbi:hypothetical protein FNZ56_09610 [Pseudoluteimonas lycopersici]|uniref:Uncharacterized protein n=1 Tax=Pseudoluteimonas lycopersici TaxID=1324796 RepID=A0A516V6H3_9GAMM|nr:hypothetical protein [Lysobacter lycopersici]QDQ74117.1 hypothetical protein FNZ56_09610 [Lysobacter lycopersici]